MDANQVQQFREINTATNTPALARELVRDKKQTRYQASVIMQEQDIPSLGKTRDDVPNELDVIYQRMVAKHPDDRFQSMIAVVDALAALDLVDLDIEDEKKEDSVLVELGSSVTQETETFLDTSRDVFATQAKTELFIPSKPRWPAIAAGLLGIIGLVWAAGIIVNIETPAGMIVLEIDDPDAIGAVVTPGGTDES
ncbi:MAG: hypothetical protein ACKVH8_04030 [Pirellulales bacterium]